MRLRVLSYNIHKGFRIAGTRFVLHEIRELLRSIDVDIVFLQEVVGQNTRHASSVSAWPEQTQYEFLADQVWHQYSYGKNAAYEHGHHGNAILSRFPISSWENLNVSTNIFEQRGALYTHITVPDSDFSFHACCTHLDLRHSGRMSQITQMTSWLNQKIAPDEPLIVAGDFNDWTDHATAPMHRALSVIEVMRKSHGRMQATFPAFFPVLSLDRIYIRGFTHVEAAVLKEKVWRRLSDHLPIYAILDTE